jgi:hypothetical protein
VVRNAGFKMGELIQGGSIAYNIIKNSQSVSRVGKIPFVNAIPSGASVEDMSGWKKTSCHLTSDGGDLIKEWDKDGKPLFHIDIFIEWLYGGKHNNVGNYISNATVNYVLYKCHSDLSFDLSVSFGKPYNRGSLPDPAAALPFAVTLNIVDRLIGIKVNEGVYQWTGEIGGFEGMDDDDSIQGWYSYQRKKIR